MKGSLALEQENADCGVGVGWSGIQIKNHYIAVHRIWDTIGR